MNKKSPITLFFLMALCGSIHAQYVSVHAEDPTNPGGMQTIVRSWNSNYAVSYYVDASFNPTMDVIDQTTGAIRRAILPGYVFIRDIFIDQATDHLYFCGATTMSTGGGLYTGVGIIGWIDINSFFTPNLIMDYHYLDQTTIIESVNKLVEYDDGGIPFIVAIGENRHSYLNYIYSEYFIVKCFNITNTPSMFAGQVPSNDRYYEVMLTDNYVVFVGYDTDPAVNSFFYRKADRWNFSDPMFDYKHPFYNGNDPLSITQSTEMPDDQIAISYLAQNNGNDFVTRVRVIDVANDANINSQEFILTDKMEPTDIVYIPDDNSLVLMQDFTTQRTTFNTNFVFIDPTMSSSYITMMEYIKDEFFHSLTMHDNIYYLAGAGASWFLKYKTQYPTGNPVPDCPIVENIDIKIIDNLDPYPIYDFLWYPVIFSTRASFLPPNVFNSTVRLNCYNL